MGRSRDPLVADRITAAVSALGAHDAPSGLYAISGNGKLRFVARCEEVASAYTEAEEDVAGVFFCARCQVGDLLRETTKILMSTTTRCAKRRRTLSPP